MSRLATRRITCAALAATVLLMAAVVSAEAQRPDSVPDHAAAKRSPEWPASFSWDTLPPWELLGPSPHGFVDLTVTIATPQQVAYIAGHDSVAEHLRSCLEVDHVDAGASGAHVPHAWAAFDSATAGRAMLRIQVVSPRISCDLPDLVAAGVVAGPGVHPGREDDLESAVVLSRGRTVAPIMAGRVPTTVVPRLPGDSTPTLHQLRLYFAPDAFAPDAHGRFAPATLIISGRDAPPRYVYVDDSVFAQAWRGFLPLRLDRLRGAASTAAAIPALELPRDSVLREARTRYAVGGLLDAAEMAARRRERVVLSNGDARFDALLVGSALLAHGDTVDALTEYASALNLTPCLRLAAHPDFDAVLQAARPPSARCNSLGWRRQLAAALIVPGGVQWVRGEHLLASAAAVLAGGLIAAAVQRHNAAVDMDHRYVQTRIYPEALLNDANALQNESRKFAIAAAGVWGASAVAGWISETVHRYRVRREQRYDVFGSTRRVP